MGFQIRVFTQVPQKLDTLQALAIALLIKKETFWTHPRIKGDYQLSRVGYKRRFSLDFAQSQVIQDLIYGTSGGGQIAISDLLGNEMYYFLVYNNARTRSEFWDGFNLAATRIDLSRRLNHSVGIYRLAGMYDNGYEGYFYEPLPFVMGGSWDLRGYRLWSLWGRKPAFMSHALRFLFIDQFYLGFPFGGIGFSSIRGALFVDAGNVWEDKPGDMLGSFGFGIRFRLGGYLVLRFDMGKKTDFKTVQDKTFTQFFFGWDF